MKRTTVAVALSLMLLVGGTAIGATLRSLKTTPASVSTSVPVGPVGAPAASQSRTEILGYTLDTLKTVKTSPLVIETRRLTPKEFTTDVNIVKWQGENIVIAVPNYNPRSEEGLVAARYNRITLIDGRGIVAQYETKGQDVTYVTLLPDRMVLKVRTGIAEMDYDGKFLWGMNVDGISHSVQPLDNGNFLILRADYDQALEITRTGEIVWEWNALESILPYSDDTFVAWGGKTEKSANIFSDTFYDTGKKILWTHINHIQKLDDGYLLSLRNQNLVVKVGFDKKVQWTFGSLLVKWQHAPLQLSNGNLLVYDNGNGRVVEFTRLGEVVWEYPIYSAVWGNVWKLDNGNYVFPSCFEGLVYEVSPKGEVVKLVEMGKMPVISVYPSRVLEWLK